MPEPHPSPDAQVALRERPSGRCALHQRWADLAFLHWAWDPAEIQARLPSGLEVETWDGKGWLGVVPFSMERIRPRGLPPLPWISWFLELNLRTYVTDEAGRPGVWFFSLDCNQPVAVSWGRRAFHLPYRHARMSRRIDADGTIDYRCRPNVHGRGSRTVWRPQGELRRAEPGTFEFFLVERYLMFTEGPNGLRQGRVFHAPYRIADLDLQEWDAEIPISNGFANPGRPPEHALFSPGVDTEVFALTP